MTDIRTASIEEHDVLVKLARTSKYTRDFSNHMFSGAAAYEKGWITVAEDDWRFVDEPELIGSEYRPVGLMCVRHKVRTPVTELYFIVVHPEYRSKGIGEALLLHLEETSPSERIGLNVMKENEAAIRFYERLGFTIVSDSLNGKAVRAEKELKV